MQEPVSIRSLTIVSVCTNVHRVVLVFNSPRVWTNLTNRTWQYNGNSNGPLKNCCVICTSQLISNLSLQDNIGGQL